MHDAKTQLSKLAARAAEGEEIVIARNGLPLAKLGPLDPPRKRREFGFCRGQIWIADDFDDPLPPDLQRAFEGLD
ncbi:MAG: type II toxin-antitoxin system Phd/YefM family antitoxin [Trebonia sp.]